MAQLFFSAKVSEELHAGSIKNSTRGVHFTVLPAITCKADFLTFRIRDQVAVVCRILVDRFRGYGVLTPENCHFPLTCCVT